MSVEAVALGVALWLLGWGATVLAWTSGRGRRPQTRHPGRRS
ncbi:hypothetical protein [Streptomyces rishiriensis]|uniref:Uncharacterized protein n=1 Tax=Streptomyces rishiriensis TaxID=68264 RepID=A0ABU0NYE5_STRRH|nr:hypothetical protein [Streptomyces rishiriensis]MDQ0584084.1 hypothetical protein [Streptomyces rishiriensis]